MLTIPHNSLVEFSGDYDGDVLNVYSPKEKCIIDAFKEGFKPSKLILDRSGGYYNPNMSPIKDEYVFLRSFFDKDYKPVDTDQDITLRKLDDILKDIKDPFNYKKIKALQQFVQYKKEISNNTYFDKENKINYDLFDDDKKEEEFITCNDSVSVFDDKNKKLNFDIFDFIDKSNYV